jgi:hypothetical protein
MIYLRHRAAVCREQTVEEFMRARMRVPLLGLGIGLMGMSAGFAAPGGQVFQDATAPNTIVQQVQYWNGGRCERLHRACVYKQQGGEVGEGNCRRYRAECSGGSYCERLRRACVYKEFRGEAGEGNCRRYRYECGG